MKKGNLTAVWPARIYDPLTGDNPPTLFKWFLPHNTQVTGAGWI